MLNAQLGVTILGHRVTASMLDHRLGLVIDGGVAVSYETVRRWVEHKFQRNGANPPRLAEGRHPERAGEVGRRHGARRKAR